MAYVHASLALETSTTTGQGSLTLAGAKDSNWLTFASVVGEGNTCSYSIVASNGQRETGVGTVVGSTLQRTTFISSSTGSKLDLPAGTHEVGGSANSASFAPASTGAATAKHIGTTPPTTPAAGDEWLNSASGITYTYYNDGSSSQWVSDPGSDLAQAASQAEMEAGTESAIRSMSPLLVAQAIAARNTDLATLHALAISF